MPKTFLIKTQSELKNIAKQVLTKKPKLLALTGPLGAGKTTLARVIGKQLGIKQVLTSPTFVLEQVYQLPKNSHYQYLIHVDCYRMKSRAELPALDLEHWLSQEKTLVIIEWANKIKSWLNKFKPTWIKIEVKDKTRKITL